jgi:hypothetical protein
METLKIVAATTSATTSIAIASATTSIAIASATTSIAIHTSQKAGGIESNDPWEEMGLSTNEMGVRVPALVRSHFHFSKSVVVELPNEGFEQLGNMLWNMW